MKDDRVILCHNYTSFFSWYGYAIVIFYILMSLFLYWLLLYIVRFFVVQSCRDFGICLSYYMKKIMNGDSEEEDLTVTEVTEELSISC
jgi:hypothetical protein